MEPAPEDIHDNMGFYGEGDPDSPGAVEVNTQTPATVTNIARKAIHIATAEELGITPLQHGDFLVDAWYAEQGFTD